LIEVPVPHPRNPAQLLSPEFLATKARLEALIHPPHEEEVGLSEEHLNMVRMVALDDEVSEVY
jgi:NitT/TauT family transport system ATP-binding protein